MDIVDNERVKQANRDDYEFRGVRIDTYEFLNILSVCNLKSKKNINTFVNIALFSMLETYKKKN